MVGGRGPGNGAGRARHAPLPGARRGGDTAAVERRTQAQRDAMTVEIGYAVVSGAVLAALTFAGAVAPALFLFDLGRTARNVVIGVATAAAGLAFVLRVVHVLWRFPRREGHRLPAPVPGRPGRSGSTGPEDM